MVYCKINIMSRIFKFLSLILIYFIIYYLLLTLTSSNDYLIKFAILFNSIFYEEPKYLLFNDLINWRLPSIYLINSFFCFFLILIVLVIPIFKKYKPIKKIFIVLSIVFVVLHLIYYLITFNEKHKIIEKYEIEKNI